MAKRLYMTSVDYVTIALSPALIMTLVGSLVFFLIDVVYVGEYEVRLCYAFALFVFATVLIARISIEMGSDRAVLFALPLAGAMFAFLVRFVEHPSPFSHLINLALMSLVWWCAHQLTWDSTVIDDDEDASGEGLMQQIGVDGPRDSDNNQNNRDQPPGGLHDNELFKPEVEAGNTRWDWLKRLFSSRKGPHTPGLWVLYFSLAALPLFGAGQLFIPTAKFGRRQYAFSLLAVYVASALALLVTTSFLNLRRYLRQRRIEMPIMIAGTWIGVGGTLIVIVMILALLIPRPNAEVALSRVPWQVGTPGSMSASRFSMNRDGGEDQGTQPNANAGTKANEQGRAEGPARDFDNAKRPSLGDSGKLGRQQSPEETNTAANDSQAGQRGGNSENEGKSSSAASNSSLKSDRKPAVNNRQQQTQYGQTAEQPSQTSTPSGNNSDRMDQSRGESSPTTGQSNSQVSQAASAMHRAFSSLGGLAGVLKTLFYIVVALLLGYGIWKYRLQLWHAIADLWRQLLELFGSKPRTTDPQEDPAKKPDRPASFSDFRDPFLSGQWERMRSEDVIRYTFAALEAWANDRGKTRTPDCTPQEFIDATLEPKTPLHEAARRLVRMYGEVAYASRSVPRESTLELRELWQLMRTASAVEMVSASK